MMHYRNIKTKYVRDKIKGKSFRNEKLKKYIWRLMLLERYVAGERVGWINALMLNQLIRQYKKEYAKICEELEIAREKREWLELGGKL